MADTEFKVGGKGYFEENWTENIIGGTITEIKHTEKDNLPYAVIKIEGTRYDTRECLLSKLSPTKEAALARKQAEDDALVQKYCDEIKTAEDLIRFMYDHNISTGACEYTSYQARKAAKLMAKQIMGINLED